MREEVNGLCAALDRKWKSMSNQSEQASALEYSLSEQKHELASAICARFTEILTEQTGWGKEGDEKQAWILQKKYRNRLAKEVFGTGIDFINPLPPALLPYTAIQG